jgi:tetratricopeptide (TPR) repeat protein
LPVAECAEILQQTARGLNAAHKLGIIHRDLKPDNIFLTRGDEGELVVKVVDFGIAKMREAATHTMTGLVLGTPAYMSYEQASGMRSDDLDGRSDVYSLGIVVYEMLTGRVPFHSDTPLGYVRKHMMDALPPFRAAAPGLRVPPELEAAVMKALSKDRDQRYASAPEFAREFVGATSTRAVPDAPAPNVAKLDKRVRAEEERWMREKAEAERREIEKAEAERLARVKAEQDRRAREYAEARRREQEKAEAERERRLREEMTAIQGLIELGNFDSAIQHAMRLQSDFPNRAEVESLLSWAKTEKDQAENRLLAALFQEVQELLNRGSFQEALSKAEAARRAFPDRPEVKTVLASINTAVEEGRKRQAAREREEQMRREAQARARAEAREREERQRLAAERAEAERLARERAEHERLAREKLEAERRAAENAEVERRAAGPGLAPIAPLKAIPPAPANLGQARAVAARPASKWPMIVGATVVVALLIASLLIFKAHRVESPTAVHEQKPAESANKVTPLAAAMNDFDNALTSGNLAAADTQVPKVAALGGSARALESKIQETYNDELGKLVGQIADSYGARDETEVLRSALDRFSELASRAGPRGLSAKDYADSLKERVANGDIGGDVIDQQGGILGRVVVEAVNTLIGKTYDGVTAPNGRYLIWPLPPGKYRVKAQLSGFQPVGYQGVPVRANSWTEQDLTLRFSARTLSDLHDPPARILPRIREAWLARALFANNYLGIADGSVSADDLNDALDVYRLVFGIIPEYAEAHLGLGLVFAKYGLLGAAIAEHREALRLKPDYPEAHYTLGKELERKGDKQGALDEYQAALRSKPREPSYRAAVKRLSAESKN